MQPEISIPQPKMSTKKCACFTPSGLVYTRLETDGTIARRPSDQKENNTRTRRSIDNDVYEPNTVESILKDNPSIGHLSFKNDEREYKVTKDKIDQLIEQTEAFLEAYERTKENIDHKRTKRRAQHSNHNKHKRRNEAVMNNDESSLECKIDKDGQVNCSQVIYNDLKAWHTNRLSLEDQIRQLRTKLEDLKEIKRHLKTTKPLTENNQTQTVHTIPINNHLYNRSLLHEHSSKEHMRRGRLHRIKPKNRNNTSFDKKFRQSNEYVMPTVNVNTNTKDDVFDVQLKNDTVTETVTQANFKVTTDESIINDTANLGELPKPQVTTVIIENNNYYHQNPEDDKIIVQSTITADDIPTTEFAKLFEMVNRKQATDEATNKESPVDFSQTLNYFNSAIDTVLSTDKPTDKIMTATYSQTLASTTLKSSTSRPSTIKATASPNLGPARFDASEYEKRNPNRNGSNSLGIFSNPGDLFQRRLHPLLIENEDKHVCYCEETR